MAVTDDEIVPNGASPGQDEFLPEHATGLPLDTISSESSLHPMSHDIDLIA